MTIPTDPGTAPDNWTDYQEHASEVIDTKDMEALAANAEQGIDMDQVIVHNMYIGWIMGVARSNNLPLEHRGGNQFTLNLEPLSGHTFVIPYPPEGWTP